jgi:NhaP-type Na+/H+ or K+/H+ antiporter
MQLFELTLLLLWMAMVLLHWAQRLRVPYPSLLALGGVCVAAMPFAARLSIEPQLALALFVAPAVMDSAFELPPREMVRNWIPLVSLAVMLVLATTAVVAWVGIKFAGLPIAAAVALGAIVAPPDAAAAGAVLREFELPRRAMTILQGESLLNDAVALLVFGIAVSVAATPDQALGPLIPKLLIAVPGGAVLGVLIGKFSIRVLKRTAGTTSSIIAQFLVIYGAWILADHIGLSPIITVVGLAMVAARRMPEQTTARDRINITAVWITVNLVLNVLAFLLMGLQAKSILNQLQGAALSHALAFSGLVLLSVILVRIVWVMSYGFLVRRLRPGGPPLRIGILVSWCGMRGLVTLATAFALPAQFPNRDVIVLASFSVVLGTLVLQGFTIRPLIAALKIAKDSSLDTEIATNRGAMLDVALQSISQDLSAEAQALRVEVEALRKDNVGRERPRTPHDDVRLRMLTAERALIHERRRKGLLAEDVFQVLENELDQAELDIGSDSLYLE